MDEFETRKRELLAPLFFEAGAALFDCQSFEYSVAYLLYLLSRAGVADLDPKRCAAILDDEEKKTAGQLIQMLKQHAFVSDGIEGTLVAGLTARNKLVHRYFTDNVERMPQPNEHPVMVKEVESLRSRVRRGIKCLDPLVKHLASELDGIDAQKHEETVKLAFLEAIRGE